jgi:hypothetical protein
MDIDTFIIHDENGFINETKRQLRCKNKSKYVNYVYECDILEERMMRR